ncbi:P27 family phage terminase small subunit [Aeromonas hydrophila]|uniref:P27 family phage terminase small subunit n=1 Tax=Aeromonas hydrophila TaxID=644 RepID=UPI003EC64AE7
MSNVMEMIPEVQAIYKKYVRILKKERDLKPSDYDCIALMSEHVYIKQMAFKEMTTGLEIQSNTKEGTTRKKTPAAAVYENASRMISRLHEQLLMTPKAKITAEKNQKPKEEEEEQDALEIALGKIGKK